MRAVPFRQESGSGYSNIDQGAHTENLSTSPSPLGPELAVSHEYLESAGPGSCFPPASTRDEDSFNEDPSISYSNPELWLAPTAFRGDSLFPMFDETCSYPSLSAGSQMQNATTMYDDSFPTNAAAETWTARSNTPGYSPHRMQDMLVGIPDSQHFQGNFQGHPMMYEFDDSSMSSLSSLYTYSLPEPQPSVIDPIRPSHVPWSRPDALGVDVARSPLWMKSTGVPDQSITSTATEQAHSGTHFRCTPFFLQGAGRKQLYF